MESSDTGEGEHTTKAADILEAALNLAASGTMKVAPRRKWWARELLRLRDLVRDGRLGGEADGV